MHWLHTQMALLDAARAVVSFAANWLLQSTLLIAAGLAVARLARCRGSALQSAIYRTTLAAVIVCPLATALLARGGVSGWSLRMPAAWENEPIKSSPLGVAAVRSQAVEPHDDFGGENVGWDQRVERAPAHHAERPSRWAGARKLAFPTKQPAAERPAPVTVRAPRSAAEAHEPSPFHVRPFGLAAIGFGLIWLAVSALLLARLAMAWRRLRQLRCAGAAAEPAAQQACRQLAALLAVTAPEVRRSPYLASPCLAGLLLPVVLLPEAEASLPLRDVLVHELAHLRRRDGWWNLLTRLTEALFFHQPLVWMLARRLESAAEEVCDDYVVQFGGDRVAYARGLLEIAELSSPPVGAAGVAMVSLRSILARRVMRIVDSSRSLSTRAGNLVLAIVIVGGLTCTLVVGFVGLAQHPSANAEPISTTAAKEPAAGAGNKEQKASEPVAKTKARATADDVAQPGYPLAGAAGSSDIDDLITVTGKVVDPEGKPFAGAKLYAVRWYCEPHIPHPPLAETTSGAEGRFTIAYRKSQFNVDVGRMDQWKEVSIVATADGFGPGWVTWRDLPRGEEATLRLVTDDAPIAGRVVDLEGKPVAGVTLRVGSIHTGKGGNLEGWLAAVRRGEFPWTAVKHLDDSLPQFDAWPPAVMTDDDGRFRVNGLGRERRVHLSFSGPTIAYQEIEAVTRRSNMFPLKFSRSEQESEPVYGAEFELVVPPTQPITGIVRDAETRRPLAGVSIESDMFAGSNFINTRQLRAVSDEQGRYRLVGMPKGAGNQILAVPNDDQPYLMRDVKVPELRGLEPVDVDIELHRGIWITGRITDLRTGEPLIARLHYLPFRSNEYAQKTPEFAKTGSADGFQDRYVSRPDGSYRLVGLPGRAIVAAQCVLGHYRKGVGAEQIAGMNERGNFDTYRNPITPGKKWPSAIKEINPLPGTEEVVCDFALDPGEKVTVNVLDGDGKPVDGFETQGSGQSWSDSPDLHGSFDVITLSPDEARTVIIRHKQRKLGKVIRVRLADHPSRSFSVTLEPTGRIVGRLLDRQGTPLSGAAIEALLKPTGDFSQRLPTTTTDGQGRFEYTDIPAGCRYDFNATAAGMKLGGGWFANDVAVEPGETKDLGDVVYGAAVEGAVKKPAAAKSEPPKEPVEPVANTKAKADSQPAADNKQRPMEKTVSADDDLITVTGKVVDPEGKPFAGAKLYAVRWYWEPHIPHPPLAETTSDADGRFTISYRKSQFTVDVRQIDGWKDVSIVATADGFGTAWVTWSDLPRGKEPTLRLVTDDVPIAGRVVDLEGKPVAGVTVRVGSIITAKGGNLDAWLAAVRRGEFTWTAAQHLDDELPQFDGWPPRVVTGDDGRFSIHGLGRERRVHLSLTGPTIAYRQIVVATRRADMLPLKFNGSEQESELVYGAEFELVAPPTQPITGIVRDAETRQPLAGVSIESNTFAGSNWINTRYLRAVSDEQGRYRLVGMPKGAGNRILAVPNDDQPYLMRDMKVPELRGLESVDVDIELHRGIWITGRVTDLRTGEPVLARLHYLPFWTNEYAQKTPEFGKPRTPDGFETRYVSRPDGSYRLVGLPGRAIVGAESVLSHYRAGVGAESITGMDEYGRFRTFPNPIEPGKKWPHAMKEINPLPGTEQVACDLALDPGEKLTVNVLDRDGKPLEGFETQGRGVSWSEPQVSRNLHANFDVITLGPEETRTVIIRHKERKLGKVIRVRLADHPTGSLSVTLEPTARVVGRLVDREGTPISGAALEAVLKPHEDLGQALPTTATDEQGRFEYSNVPIGCRYELSATAAGLKPFGSFAKDVAVEPGETKDLGDVVYGAAVEGNKNAETKPANKLEPVNGAIKKAAAIKPASEKIVRGRVLLPGGKPAAGADLYWPHAGSPPPRAAREIEYTKRGVTDAEGWFQIAFSADDLPASGLALYLVAHKPGFGIDWLKVESGEVPAEITLQLVEDRPIRGRVTDTEGRPIAGARLAVNNMWESHDGNLDAFLDAWHLSSRESWRRLDHRLHSPLDAIISTVSDRDGRFELSGIGRERVASVEVIAPGYAADQLRVVNREGFDAGKYNDISRATLSTSQREREQYPRLTGPDFDYVAEVELVVRGKVFTGRDQPRVAGAVVRSFGRGYGQNVEARTDERGRYELHGLPRNRNSLLSVAPLPSSGLIPRTLDLAAAPRQAAIELDVELKQGILVEGRVFDQATGRGLKGGVRFTPLPGNDFVKQPGFDGPLRSRVAESTDEEGRFRLLIIPGPGVLLGQVYGGGARIDGHEIEPYRQATFSEADRKRAMPTEDVDDRHFTATDNSVEFLTSENAAKVLDLARDTGTFHCDLPVDPGKTVQLAIEDDAGRPVRGAFVSGLADCRRFTFRISEPTCTVYALGADRPRRVCILHPERHLAASLTLTGGEHGPVTARLDATAGITGRALDASGEPIADAVVVINYARRSASELDRFVGLERPALKTDDQGRFEVGDVVPGERFALDFREDDAYFRANLTDEQRQLKAGQKLELGDMKVKQL